MNITKDQTSELTATIHITIEQADYMEEVNKSLKDYQRKANMPGFRPGKVPFGMVKKMYGKSLIADKVNNLISEALNNYIVGNKLAILGHPIANMDKTGTVDFDEQTEMNFYFDIGLAPEFTIDLESINKPTYIKATADEKAVDEAIENIRKQAAKEVQVEEVGANDRMKLSIFEVDTNGNELENGYRQSVSLLVDDLDEPARGIFIGKPTGSEFVFNFATAISDLSKVEQLLKLDENNKELAKASFNVIIDEVFRTEEVVMDESLFSEVYPNEEVTDAEQFRARVAKDVERQYQHDTDRYFFNKAIDAIIDHHQFELPDEFMKKWVLDNNENKLTAEDLEKDYVNYARTFRWQLILSKLESENEDLAVQPHEIRNFVKGYFFGRIQTSDGVDEEMDNRMEGIVDTILQNKEEEQKIKEQIADQKLVGFIKEKLQPKEELVSYDDFVKLVTENNKKDE